jgi:hypothetical protein
MINLIENNFSDGIQINEAKDKSLHIQGPFIQVNEKNQNGRIYPGDMMESAVALYTEKYIIPGRALGELNHPESRMDVDPERACILIKEFNKEGNYYIGKAKVLSHVPMGKLVEGLLKDGVKLGVSTRGTGKLVEGNKVANFSLKTVDVVHDPSAQTAFVDSLMEQVNNNMQHLYEIKSLKEEVDNLKESLKTGSYKSDESFLDVIKNLKIQ